MKTIFTTLALACISSICAQNFQGKAIYKTNKKSNITLGNGKNAKMTDAMKAQIKARLQKMNQKTFILEFDKSTSIYKQEAKLNTPTANAKGTVAVLSLGNNGATDVYYKNIKEAKFINQTEIQGKRFLVKDNLKNFKWELRSETKNIGNYTCYKAVFFKEVSKTTKVVEDGELVKKKNIEKVVTTAWYTPQIPVSNGPSEYQGLPGLILEINDGTTTIVCTEIMLDKRNTITIHEPKKGKEVSQKKYLEIRKQKQEEMLAKFRSRKGMDLGNGRTIRITN